MFDWLFGKKESVHHVAQVPAAAKAVPVPAAAAPAQAVAPGTGIHYHPDLIGKLTQEHQNLLRLFEHVQHAAQEGDVVLAARHLEAFRVQLQGHLLTENVRLYVYLEHALAADASSHQLMRAFRHEMDDIGKAVVDFLGHYRELAQRPDLTPKFIQSLEGIGAVLVERIRREEGILYPLYTA
ncbi:MAG: hemerythrin domain-containing protein [Rhodoferax sp.]